MNLPSEIFGKVIVVHTPEELSAEQAEQFVDHVTTLERDNIVLDLDNTEILDSAGLSALLDARDVLDQRHGQIKISATNTVNRKILEITRLDRQIDVFSSVVDAVKSFQ